jgi:hypothetical protein
MSISTASIAPLEPRDRARVRRLLKRLGVRGAARALGLAKSTLDRAAFGAALHVGTRRVLLDALTALGDDDKRLASTKENAPCSKNI